jgi:peptidyl-prolyl cis-trans isomerase B (cyclophilin B)
LVRSASVPSQDPDNFRETAVIRARKQQFHGSCSKATTPLRNDVPMTEQPPRYPPPYPYVQYPPFNPYAILSLVFAIFVLPPLGIYFGNVAKRQIAATGERGIELANVGVICGWILSVVMGLFLVVWCGFFVFIVSSAPR